MKNFTPGGPYLIQLQGLLLGIVLLPGSPVIKGPTELNLLPFTNTGKFLQVNRGRES
jgi:hypothetical protein